MPVKSSPFLRKVRIRACGILVENQRILLVKHLGLGIHGYFWSPPGGGTEFGESYQDTLIRELMEETRLSVLPGEFLAFHEHIDDRFHAMELFFRAQIIGGEAVAGSEPESPDSEPFLEDVAWFTAAEINAMPAGTVHKLCRGFLDAAFAR